MVTTIATSIKRANVKKVNKKLYEPKQKWFGWKCFRFRSVMLKSLENIGKNLQLPKNPVTTLQELNT